MPESATPGTSWAYRMPTFPHLTGGKGSGLDNLRFLLTRLSMSPQPEDTFEWPERNTPGDPGGMTSVGPVLLVEAVRALGLQSGLVQYDANGQIEITAAARRWLSTGDNLVLAMAFHASIRYFGEMLWDIENGISNAEDLRVSASTTWGLEWRSKDQVNRRLTFFQAAGLVGRGWDSERERRALHLTADGRALLKVLELQDPTTIKSTELTLADLPEVPPILSGLLGGLDERRLAERLHSFGYVPADGRSQIETIKNLAQMATTRVSLRDLKRAIAREFRVTDSSAQGVLNFLRGGIVKQVDENDYQISPVGAEWLAHGADPVLLVYIVHAHCKFLGELLFELCKPDGDTIAGLTTTARTKYELRSISKGEVTKRVQLAKNAGLVRCVRRSVYETTPLGLAFLAIVALEQPSGVTRPSDDTKVLNRAEILAAELRDAARDSNRPSRLERAVANALSHLGYTTEWLGGSGETDVLVTACIQPGRSMRIMFDAKSAYDGRVTEGQVKFDVLAEHKQRHGAEAIVLVGERFAGRIPKWAEEHGVVLLSVDRLSSLLLENEVGPLAPVELLPALLGSKATGPTTGDCHSARVRRNEIAADVMTQLEYEAIRDVETSDRALTLATLCRLISEYRNPPPSEDEVSEVLALFSSPFLGGVSATTHGYVQGVPLQTVKQRMRALDEAVPGIPSSAARSRHSRSARAR